MNWATPLTTPVVVKEAGADFVVTEMDVDPADPIFAGHYPGYPIYPGVCLVENANAGVLALAEQRGLRVRLAAVESARFHHPAFPGTQVVTRTDITEKDGGWRCSAILAGAGVQLAVVRLRYHLEADR